MRHPPHSSHLLNCSSEQCSPRTAPLPHPWRRPPDPPPVCTVEYGTAHQWDSGSQRSVTLTGLGTATSRRSLGFASPG